MQEPDRVAAIFSDSHTLFSEAIEILELGKHRVAAEVAWGATKRATDALILARTGREPTGTGQTTRGIGYLAKIDADFVPLERLYNRRIVWLHGRCFYAGNCNEATDLVRGTSDYIRDAEKLASMGAGDGC